MISPEKLLELGIIPSEYNKLSEEEKEVVNEVLSELADGREVSKSYEKLYYEDYDEIPVDFDTFVNNDYYLGKSTRNGEFLYPFWRNEAKRILSRTDISEVALSGSIGIGKTTNACIMIAYKLYQLMCMKDPQAFFGLSPGSQIAVAFLNNTLSSSYSVGYETFQSFVINSPWFLKHGTISGRNEPRYYPKNGFKIIVGSRPQHTLGLHLALALLDEVSFAPGQDVNYEKSKVMALYTSVRRRMESRFMIQGKCYGMAFLVSSKATESSFLEAYIADQVKKGYPIYVVDQPLWKVKPAAYSGEMFKVAVGNKYLPSRIVRGDNIESQCEALKKQGLNIIDVPIEHMQAFDQDIDKALQDIAGISTATVTKAFNGQRVQKCVSSYLKNPFQTEVVTLGIHDPLNLKDFFDVTLLPEEVLGAPMFIHLDASVSGDRTGLSGVAIIGTKRSQQVDDTGEIESEELLCQQVFTVGIQAPSDSEISFEKTRQFIYYLHDEVGLNIKKVTTDGFQSVDSRQILYTKGYDVGYTSLDRSPDGYDSLRSAVNDRRIILLQDCEELYNELTELERDNLTRKYDHPAYARKDEADSLAGAYYDALQYKDEYIYWSQSDIDYEGVNDNTDERIKDLENMKQGLVASSVNKRSEDKRDFSLFNPVTDSNILYF